MLDKIKMSFLKLKLKLSDQSFWRNLLLKKSSYPLTFWSSIIAIILILSMFFFITLPSVHILGIIAWKNIGWLVLCSAIIVFDIFLYEKPKNCEYDSKARRHWYYAFVFFTVAIIAVLAIYGNSVQSLWQ